MIEHIPYIHLIQIYNENYLYDVNTNGIVHISDEIYNFLNKLLSNTAVTKEQMNNEYNALSEECKSDIELLKQRGFLCDKNENIIFRHPETEGIHCPYMGVANCSHSDCGLRCLCLYKAGYCRLSVFENPVCIL